jgi:two-component sensor histidine kinase
VASCSRLGRLISNLLDVSRFDAGAVALDTVELDLRDLARAVATELADRAREAGLLLDLELPPQPLVVAGDRERLLQVLHNLVDNAIKYSPRGGRVALSVRGTDELPEDLPEAWRNDVLAGPAYLVAEVADEGRGVPPADRERIFERFFRAAHGSGGPSGVGLGLAICRELVAAHGGAIWVTGKRPAGSRFRVLLPAARPSPARRRRVPRRDRSRRVNAPASRWWSAPPSAFGCASAARRDADRRSFLTGEAARPPPPTRRVLEARSARRRGSRASARRTAHALGARRGDFARSRELLTELIVRFPTRPNAHRRAAALLQFERLDAQAHAIADAQRRRRVALG